MDRAVDAVERALAWGGRWRAIDPGNPAIDQQLGQVMLDLADPRAAWRQLSSLIEHDPWSGTGYTTIAEALADAEVIAATAASAGDGAWRKVAPVPGATFGHA